MDIDHVYETLKIGVDNLAADVSRAKCAGEGRISVSPS
jgi:hypothetical protein